METVTFTDASGHSRVLPWNDNTLNYLSKLSYASELTVHFGAEFVWIVSCGTWRAA
jgi:hypothetical protein